MAREDIEGALPPEWTVTGVSDDGDCVVLKHVGDAAPDLGGCAPLMATYGYEPRLALNGTFQFVRG